jgi:DNA-binding MarR family transcriptional regulator
MATTVGDPFDYETARNHLDQGFPEADPDLLLLFLGICRLGKILERDTLHILRADDLETSDHHVLVALLLNGVSRPLTPTQLSNRIVQTTGGMTKTIVRLERAGLVGRSPDPGTARGQLIRLTPAGRAVVERQFRERFERWLERLERTMPGEPRVQAELIWQLMTERADDAAG